MISDELFVKIIQNGIDVNSSTPYLELAKSYAVSEVDIISKIEEYKKNKKIKRFGPVVSNRKIGMLHNAMVTLKVCDEKIEEVGNLISSFDFVTLCYQRKIIPNVWEYNLYFMIHGTSREIVNEQIQLIMTNIGPVLKEYKVLFSLRCFKQKGASYAK